MGAPTHNKKVRQENLREFLSKQKLIEKVIDISKKLEENSNEIESSEVAALKASSDIRMKLINKYLPDLKQTELVGEGGEGPVVITWQK